MPSARVTEGRGRATHANATKVAGRGKQAGNGIRPRHDAPVRQSVRNRANGAWIASVFALIWALAGTSYVPGAWRTAMRIVAIAVSFVLVFSSWHLLHASRRLSVRPGHPHTQSRRWYLVLTVAEFAAILTASLTLAAMGAALLILPVTALIVGLHFFPLALILRERLYYLIGAVLVGLGTIGILGDTDPWVAVSALGAAVVLRLGSVTRLVTGWRIVGSQAW